MSTLPLSEEQIRELALRVNQISLETPRCWGDPGRVAFGNNVHLANTLFNTSSGMIVVGDDAFFGHNVSVITGTHKLNKKGAARHDLPADGHDILIGCGVWVASGVTILGPSRIGDNAVIAAGAVLTGGEYPGGHVYAGIPAK